MNRNSTDFACLVTGFLTDYLPLQRCYSSNTLLSYRDTLKLFLRFLGEAKGISPVSFYVKDFKRELVIEFLEWYRQKGAGISAANQRLAAIKAFAGYAQFESIECIAPLQEVAGIKAKKASPAAQNFTQNTCNDYYRFTKRFLEFTGKDAMSITYADIRKFIFHMKDNESKKASTVNVYTAAIRFFFEYTLGYVWDPKKIPKMKRDRQLPVILTREQVNALIDSMDNYKHKAITSTMYSSGLRVSGVCRLRYEDIRRSQKMIHVPLSKNRQDRYTILSDRNLEIFTEYWYRYGRPRGWLFPSTVRDAPLIPDAVEIFVRGHARKLGLPEGVTPHTLRHCFACHSLEDGISHTFIQQLLGHRSPNSTDVYLQMTSKSLMGIKSPFDTFKKSGMEGCGDV